MIIWTPAVLSVLYACILYFYTCSAQLSMFHMQRHSRNTLIIIINIIVIIIIIIIIMSCQLALVCLWTKADSKNKQWVILRDIFFWF